MGTEDANQPPSAERPKRRMVLRKIGQTLSPLPPLPPLPSTATSLAAPALPSQRAATARIARPASSTVRPPPPPDSDPNEPAAPIPLTRLHTPRPRFRSAIDFPAYAPGPAADEGSVRESSSTTLPPLVASLPPPAGPLYLPAPPAGSFGSRASSRAKAMARSGAVAFVALVVVVAGVAVGRRVARTVDEPGLHVLATAAPGGGSAERAGSAGAASQPPPPQDGAHETAAIVLPAPTGAAGMPIEATTSVEALPRAPATPLPVRVAPAQPRPVARPAPSVAQAVTGPIRAAGKDPIPSDESDDATTPASPKNAKDGNGAQAAPREEEAPVDPLVKAVRADIEEEEARRK